MGLCYGIENCEHDLVYRIDGHVEYCSPAVCTKCGAFGCFCDAGISSSDKDFEQRKKDFFEKGVKGDANVNGLWKNPYVNSLESKS